MRINFEDAAWLWLESKPWAVTPELLFASKQLIINEAENLKEARAFKYGLMREDIQSRFDETLDYLSKI